MVGYILRASLVILLLLYFAMPAEACNYPVTVTDGTTCTGILLSDKQFLDASNDKKKLRLQDLKIAQYEGMEELYDMRHAEYVKELRHTKSELRWLETKSTIGYVISFSLGAFITGTIAKEVLK